MRVLIVSTKCGPIFKSKDTGKPKEGGEWKLLPLPFCKGAERGKEVLNSKNSF